MHINVEKEQKCIYIEKWLIFKTDVDIYVLHRVHARKNCVWKTKFSLDLYQFVRASPNVIFEFVSLWPINSFLFLFTAFEIITQHTVRFVVGNGGQYSEAENMIPRESIVWYIFEKLPNANWCYHSKTVDNRTASRGILSYHLTDTHTWGRLYNRYIFPDYLGWQIADNGFYTEKTIPYRNQSPHFQVIHI